MWIIVVGDTSSYGIVDFFGLVAFHKFMNFLFGSGRWKITDIDIEHQSFRSSDQSVYYQYNNNQVIKEEILNPDGSSDIINFEFEGDKVLNEKHFNIPQGEQTQDDFLIYTKRFLYEE